LDFSELPTPDVSPELRRQLRGIDSGEFYGSAGICASIKLAGDCRNPFSI
jgi:hypothetical protein